MDDEAVQDRIEALEAERLRLREDENLREGQGEKALEPDRTRLEEISVELEGLWDLLRRRRALRNAGQDPEDA